MTGIRLFIYAFLLFIIDILSAALLQNYAIFGLLCFYANATFEPNNRWILVLLMVLICLEQFLIFGHLGLPLLYLLPASLVAFRTRNLFYQHNLQPMLFILFCLGCQLFIIEPFFLNLFDRKIYTLEKFFGNILLSGLFSLKFKSTES